MSQPVQPFGRARVVVALAVLALVGCATPVPVATGVLLIDGAKGLENFSRVGNANWQALDGAIQADGTGFLPTYLVSKAPYRDFVLRVEFWASADANSGVLFRCRDPERITDQSCYEANIFDSRPEPAFGTGAVMHVARVAEPYPKASGRWNTYEIIAKGSRLVVTLNGVKTVDVEDTRHLAGHVALQWARGTVRFRRVELRPL